MSGNKLNLNFMWEAYTEIKMLYSLRRRVSLFFPDANTQKFRKTSLKFGASILWNNLSLSANLRDRQSSLRFKLLLTQVEAYHAIC